MSHVDRARRPFDDRAGARVDMGRRHPAEPSECRPDSRCAIAWVHGVGPSRSRHEGPGETCRSRALSAVCSPQLVRRSRRSWSPPERRQGRSPTVSVPTSASEPALVRAYAASPGEGGGTGPVRRLGAHARAPRRARSRRRTALLWNAACPHNAGGTCPARFTAPGASGIRDPFCFNARSAAVHSFVREGAS